VLDSPTGATIVCTFGAVLVLMFFIHVAKDRWRGQREPSPTA
jgi:hypothetical protein